MTIDSMYHDDIQRVSTSIRRCWGKKMGGIRQKQPQDRGAQKLMAKASFTPISVELVPSMAAESADIG